MGAPPMTWARRCVNGAAKAALHEMRRAYPPEPRPAATRRATSPSVAPAPAGPDLPVALATVTGAIDFPAIVPMLTGFLANVGTPSAILVVDDGTLDERQRECIRSISPLVEFFAPRLDPDLPAHAELERYMAAEPMGKKLAMLIELTAPGRPPLLYTDTDVWFSDRSGELVDLLQSPVESPWFMPDRSSTSLDSRFTDHDRPHVNSGFMLLPSGMDWTDALAASVDMIDRPEWFTEQTVVHQAIHQHGARCLPPERYLLSWDDRRSRADLADADDVVVRHYVVPVRHKYWVRVHGGYRRTATAVARHVLRTRPAAVAAGAAGAAGTAGAVGVTIF